MKSNSANAGTEDVNPVLGRLLEACEGGVPAAIVDGGEDEPFTKMWSRS